MFNLFKKNTNKINPSEEIKFHLLTDLQQLNTITEESTVVFQLLFKHSTRCIISKMALKNFESEFDFQLNNIKCYCLDLLNYRDISNTIAEKFDVVHQSPQIILIKDKTAIYHTSHESIDASKIIEIINKKSGM